MQADPTPSPAPRDLSLDNVRTLMVLAVLLLHASCAYAFGIPWWHAQDAKHLSFDILIIFMDGFALPTLYFVAGAFSLPSLTRHGGTGFMVRKLKRLGLPVVLLSAFYLPAMVYLGYLHRTEAPLSFMDYWLHWMATAADWGFVLITDMVTGARYQDAFAPHHLWFMSLLLVFFAAHVLWRAVRTGPPHPGPARNTDLSFKGLAAWTVVVALAYAAMNAVIQDWAWARLGPLLLFQPTRVPVYAGAFILGTLARPRLASGRPMPGPTWFWLLLFLSCQTSMILNASLFIADKGPLPWPLALAHGTLRAALAIAAICLTVNLARRFLAAPSPWRQSLATSSYDIYMLHMPLAVVAQAALLAVAVPLGVKMILVFGATLLVCWGLSRAMARYWPWLPAGLLAAWFAGFCLLY